MIIQDILLDVLEKGVELCKLRHHIPKLAGDIGIDTDVLYPWISDIATILATDYNQEEQTESGLRYTVSQQVSL